VAQFISDKLSIEEEEKEAQQSPAYPVPSLETVPTMPDKVPGVKHTPKMLAAQLYN